MPRIALRDDIPAVLLNPLIDELEGIIGLEMSDEKMMVTSNQIGTFVVPYDPELSRPCEPISITLTALDRPGRRERLQKVIDNIPDRHSWIKQLPKRHEKYIDLDFDARQENEWVAA